MKSKKCKIKIDKINMKSATHEQLWEVCRDTKEYEEGKTQEMPGCFACKWYHKLEGDRGMDWGVCYNKKSPRAGLLTFEHMSCKFHKAMA